MFSSNQIMTLIGIFKIQQLYKHKIRIVAVNTLMPTRSKLSYTLQNNFRISPIYKVFESIFDRDVIGKRFIFNIYILIYKVPGLTNKVCNKIFYTINFKVFLESNVQPEGYHGIIQSFLLINTGRFIVSFWCSVYFMTKHFGRYSFTRFEVTV